MKSDLTNIEVAQLYRLQKDIDIFISKNQKSSSFLIALWKSTIDIIKSIFNPFTICCFITFCISSTISLYSLKLLGKFSQKAEQIRIISTIFDIFILSTSFAVVFALISIISAPLYYNYTRSKKRQIESKEKQNLYEYFKLKTNIQVKFLTINEFAFDLYEKYNLLELKLKEEELKTNIEDHESSRKLAIIPLSILFILFSIFAFEIIMGISTTNMINTFNVHFKGVTFIIFTTTICNFALDWTLFSSIKFKKQALSAIKKAQILITET